MKVAVSVNVMQAGGDLMETTRNQAGRQRSSAPRFRELIEVSLHALKDEV